MSRGSSDELTFIVQIMIPGPPYLSLVIGWHRPVRQDEKLRVPSRSFLDDEVIDPFEISLARWED